MLTTTKVIAVVGLIFGALFASGPQWGRLLQPSATVEPSLGASAVALVIVLYCYLGWNVASYIAGEVTDARRTLPRILIGGTAFVAAIYLMLNLMYFSALTVDQLAQEPVIPVAEKAAAALWGASSGRVVAGLLCLSIAGAVSAMVWAGPRVYWAMARDGAISPWLARLDPQTGVPVRAILFQSAWASVLIISGTFEQLLVYSGLVLALFMALSLSTIFRLRATSAGDEALYRSPWYPVLPALLVAGTLALVGYSLWQRPLESLYGAATVIVGIPVYLWWKRTTR